MIMIKMPIFLFVLFSYLANNGESLESWNIPANVLGVGGEAHHHQAQEHKQHADAQINHLPITWYTAHNYANQMLYIHNTTVPIS